MALRKWLVRSLVIAMAGTLAAGAVAYQHWTNPEAVRAKVLDELSNHLPGGKVRLESARMSLLGGITFSNMRLVRRDDPNQAIIIDVPSGTIYPDKEELRHGRVTIRKFVLDRAQVHVVRRKDGSINFAGILLKPDLSFKVPTIELNHSIFSFEDLQADPNAAPLVARDVHLTIVNDPRPTLVFNGHGVSDLLGPIKVQAGKIGRASDEFSVNVDLPAVQVGGELIERLSAYHAEAGSHGRQLKGKLSLQAQIQRTTTSPRWNYDVRAHLKEGEFQHARLPMPLTKLEAKAHWADGQLVVEKLSAVGDPAHIEMNGKISCPGFADVDGTAKIERLPASPAVINFLPEGVRHIVSEYDPHGLCSLTIEFHDHNGQIREHCQIRPEGMDGCYAKFPYRLERITGRIEQEMDSNKSLLMVGVNLEAFAGQQPVSVVANVRGRQAPALDLTISARGVVIEDRLKNAVPLEFHKLIQSFSPTGLVDVDARVHKPEGQHRLDYRYLIGFRECSMAYDYFPYPVEHVTGVLDIHADHWEFHNFHATHKGAVIEARAGSSLTGKGKETRIEIAGRNLLLDDELYAALQHQGLQSTWDKLEPRGRIAFYADVILEQDRKDPEISVTVTPNHCSIRPSFFPYRLEELDGTVVYRQHSVVLSKLTARHGATLFQLDQGKVLFKPDGNLSVDLVRLLANPLVPDEDLQAALPPQLGAVVRNIGLKDPVSLLTNMTIVIPHSESAPPSIYWDGGLRLKDATLHAGVTMEHVNGVLWCRGQHSGKFGNVVGNIDLSEANLFGQPFRAVQSHILVDEREPDVFKLPDLKARLFGGDVGGEIRLMTGGSRTQYAAHLTGSQIQLDQFGKHNDLGPKAQLQGAAVIRAYLQGEGEDLAGLSGNGSFDVENGKLYNLPLLLDLLKFLNLRWPDRTAFEDAHMRFSFKGPIMQIDQIDLLGNAISLGGKGMLDLTTKEIRMDLYAVMGRVASLSLPPFKEILPAISKSLLKIKMTGRIGNQLRFEKEILPLVQEPFKELLQPLRQRNGA